MQQFLQAAIIGIMLGAQYALLALGFTLIFGILGVVNFAHGGLYALGGYLAYAGMSVLGMPYPLAALGAAIATAALGYAFELLLVERRLDDPLSTMMLCLGFNLVISTAILAAFGPLSPEFAFPITGTLRLGGLYAPVDNLIVLCTCLAAIGGLYCLIYRTAFGRALRALAEDRSIAAAQGVRPKLMFPLAFALATGLAGLTGALVTPILQLSPTVGDPVLVTSFLTVILGGLGSIAGATAAAFVVGIIEAYSSVYLGGSSGALALFVLVLIILVIRPTGLFTTATRRT